MKTNHFEVVEVCGMRKPQKDLWGYALYNHTTSNLCTEIFSTKEEAIKRVEELHWGTVV